MIKFTIFTSDDDLWHDKVVLNNNGKRLQMKKIPRKDGWLFYKYGEKVDPWECRLMVQNQKGDATGGFVGKKFQLQYNYEKMSSSNFNNSVKEREPLRILEI